jgi:uncharacterized protein YecT (DUF1311 family)
MKKALYPHIRMSWHLVLLLLQALLVTSLADAQNSKTTTDELKPAELADRLYTECGEQWLVRGAIATCVLEKEEAFGKQLEQVYKKALTLAGTNDTLLRESQRSWLKYQESTCKLVEAQVRHEGPTIGRAAAAGCLLRMTLERLEELRGFVTLLEKYGPL